MSYSILGPLTVRYGDKVVTPSPFKVRVILAVLLARANAVVSVDTLIQELWAEEPPRTVLQALRVYVSQLRQALRLCPEGTTGLRLVTQTPGYRLEVEPEQLDAMRFERLCGQGKLAYARRDLEAARRYYGEALELRRGSALSDVRTGLLLQGVAIKLDEMWIATLLRRIDIDMQLGRHDVVAELRELEVAHPLHEGLHARLMIALFNNGRTKDALDVYRSTRAALINELGVEPHAILRSVHAAILNSDHQLLRVEHLSSLGRAGSDLADV